MAGDMIWRLSGVLCLACFTSAGVAAGEELLADPTRPPAAALMMGAGMGEAQGSRLSSIVLPKQGRATAVIDGQVVRLGERVGGARLLRLTESEAVLEGPEGVERLYLTPDVDKKMNATKAASRRKKE